MKKFGVLIVVLIAVVLVAVLAKNIVAKNALSSGVKMVTGLGLEIERLDIGIVKTLVDIDGLRLLNPKGFVDRVMVDIPEVYVDYDLGAFLQKRVHLRELRLELKELAVIKNKEGLLNLDSLKAVQSAKGKDTSAEKGQAKPAEVSIDLLSLKIGKVIYKDYSKGAAPAVREFAVNIDERFENITDLQKLARLILVTALVKTPIASLTGFDLSAISADVSQAVKDAAATAHEAVKQAGEAAGEVADEATESLKGAGESLKDMFKIGE